MNTRTEELFNNKEFAAKLLSMNAMEAKTAIEAEGGEITYEELHEIAEGYNEVIKKLNENNGELSADMLDEVAGGSWRGACRGCLFGLVGGFMLAGPKGAAAGALGGFVYGAVCW